MKYKLEIQNELLVSSFSADFILNDFWLPSYCLKMRLTFMKNSLLFLELGFAQAFVRFPRGNYKEPNNLL